MNITFTPPPHRGTFRLTANTMQSPDLAFDADPADWQAAADAIAPDGQGLAAISSVVSLSTQMTVTVNQTGVAPTEDDLMGVREIITIELLDIPVGGSWQLRRNGESVGTFPYNVAGSAIAAALGSGAWPWYCDGGNYALFSGDPVPRFRFISSTGVAPSEWSVTPNANDPLVMPCEVVVS